MDAATPSITVRLIRSVYGWYLAQLIALVFAILVVRGSFLTMGGFMVNATLADLPQDLVVLDPDGFGMAESALSSEGVAPAVDGDALSNALPGRR